MTIDLEFQNVSDSDSVPKPEEFEKWIFSALRGRQNVSLAIRVVNADEMRKLNQRYRGKDKPGNVLSFTAELPDDLRAQLDVQPLGDIVICAQVVEDEAGQQGKTVSDHWAHLTVHGLLHLLGYDHQRDEDAQQMEALEIECLNDLGIADPYNH